MHFFGVGLINVRDCSIAINLSTFVCVFLDGVSEGGREGGMTGSFIHFQCVDEEEMRAMAMTVCLA